jgi:hypothetical protein
MCPYTNGISDYGLGLRSILYGLNLENINSNYIITYMSEYTRTLTAQELIRYIANDYVELSSDKVRWQRDDFIQICQEWLEYNYTENTQ